MEICPDNLLLKQAKLKDHDAILAITEKENLYGGLDYLPFALKAWLREGEEPESYRRNLAFVLDGKIVGFISLYFQNSWKVCVKFAFRISKSLRGKGFGIQITELVRSFLTTKFPTVENVISAIPDTDLSDKEIKSDKLGDLLGMKPFLVYSFQLKTIFGIKVAENNLSYIQKEDFKKLLQSKGKVNPLLEHNIVHMNWVPVILGTEADIEFATRKKQEVLLNGSVDDPISFSILTLPYSVPNGNTRSSIDIFATEDEDVKNHIQQQIKHLANKTNDIAKIGKTLLSIFVHQSQEKVAIEAMMSLGLEEYRYRYGTQNREVNHMYIYQKQI